MRRARQKGAKIIVAEPRAIDMSEHAEVFLQIRPGTNIALLNGMMKTILDEGLANQAFIAERTENIDALKEQLAGWSAEQAADICGIEAEKIRDAARLYAKANSCLLYTSRGESMMRAPVTPQALQPNPIHMVRHCLPCAQAFRKNLSMLKAMRGR